LRVGDDGGADEDQGEDGGAHGFLEERGDVNALDARVWRWLR
jgi:hypothetical protein